MDAKAVDQHHPVGVAIVCFINDPFDVPGGRRIGGGHLVLRELGEFLVCQGFDVTYITRLNAPDKPSFKQLGQRCRIHRVPVGPPCEVSPGEVGAMLDELEAATRLILKGREGGIAVLHSQYWIAGEVCRRINQSLGLRHIHHMLSFGRQKRSLGEEARPTDSLRDACERTVFDAVDLLVAQCPSEARDLLTLYPELGHRRIAIIPHGIDPHVFAP